jgi:hypothetical protein
MCENKVWWAMDRLRCHSTISELAHLLAIAHGVGEAIIAGAAAALAAGVHIAATIMLYTATSWLPIGIVRIFTAYFFVVAAVLTIVSLVIWIQLLKNAVHHARYMPTRCRKLVYVV